jgi:hypothetical protein
VSPTYRNFTLSCDFPRADDGIRTRDPHLGKKNQAKLPNLLVSKFIQHNRPFRFDHNEPRVTVVVNGACFLCAVRISQSRTTCTTAGTQVIMFWDNECSLNPDSGGTGHRLANGSFQSGYLCSHARRSSQCSLGNEPEGDRRQQLRHPLRIC